MSQSTLESISKISYHLDLFDYIHDLKDSDGSSYGVSAHFYRGKNGNNSIVLCRKDLQKIWIFNDLGSFLEEQCNGKEKTNSDSIYFPPSKESVEIVDISGSGIQLKKLLAVSKCQDFFVAVGYRELSMKKKSVVFKSIEIMSPRNITTFFQDEREEKKNIINIEKFQSLVELRDGVLAIFYLYLDFGKDYCLRKTINCYSLVIPERKSIEPSLRLKYRMIEGIDVVNSIVHKDCSYYMPEKPRGLVLVNLFKNEFVNTVYNSSDENIGPYIGSVYEFRPFKTLNGEEYIVTAGNFMKYYVHNTHKTNEIIKVIALTHESVHVACWRSLMVDNSYFVSGNHDGSIDVYHVGTDGNLNKAINSVRVHNELGIGFNCVQVVEKKMNSLRLLFTHNTNSKGLSVLTLTNVPFLQPEKNFEDEDLKERLEFLFVGNCENYFFGDEINRYCVSLVLPNFSIMFSKILFF